MTVNLLLLCALTYPQIHCVRTPLGRATCSGSEGRVLMPGRSGGRFLFFSRVNFLCRLLFGVRSTPMLPQWHVEKKKKKRSSAKSANSRLQLNKVTPLTHRSRNGLTMLSRHSVKTDQGSKLTHDSSGNARSLSSQLAVHATWYPL